MDMEHIPFEAAEQPETAESSESVAPDDKITDQIAQFIQEQNASGLGPRKIARQLEAMGFPIPYYKVAYFLKKSASAKEAKTARKPALF